MDRPLGLELRRLVRRVLPARRTRGFKPLAFLSRYFNAAEVNTSFYRIPSPQLTEPWVEQVPADFRFTFKLTNIFTHHREAFPSAVQVGEFPRQSLSRSARPDGLARC